ncbi:cupin domain-containing protein [Streptomyces sp. NPDC085927]|uniref:cupin domain-containing protein n=1 Tax=Streptomyces sp. NPDC085927 TaxID=3365738 RepID=UPI0037D200C0
MTTVENRIDSLADSSANSPADSPADFYERLAGAHVVPLWRVPGTDAPEPEPAEVPHVWRWRELIPLMEEAGRTIDLGSEAERRALNGVNPARQWGTTHTMVAGYQLVLPGEEATAHRHTPAAVRLMLAGRGHTTVEGEPVLMEPGDLVLTPGWNWHDHRNAGDEPMIWLDGLDVPFVRGLNAQFYEDYEDKRMQPARVAEDDSVARYGAGIVPAGPRTGRAHSPLMKYSYATTLESLERLRESEGDPEHGVTVEYTDPQTGGPVMPTLGCAAQLLPAGRRTRRRRHTSSTVFCVTRGSGHSVIGGRRYDWDQNDFFVVPSWTWYEHVAADGSPDVTLFAMSDRPMLEPFGLYREQLA